MVAGGDAVGDSTPQSGHDPHRVLPGTPPVPSDALASQET